MNIPLLLAAAVGGVILVVVTLRWPELTILLLVAVTSGIYDIKRLPYVDFGPMSLHVSDIILMVLLGVLFFRATAIRGFRFSGSPLILPLILFMLATAVSISNAIIVYGVNVNTSLRLARNIFHWFAFLPTLYLIKDERSLRRLITGLLVLAAVFLLGAFFPGPLSSLHFLSIKTTQLETAGRDYAGLARYYLRSEPLLYVMIPVSVASLAIRKGPHLRQILLMGGLGFWLVTSFQRNYWLTTALSLGLLFLLLTTSERLRIVKRLYPLLVIGLAILMFLNFAQIGSLGKTYNALSDRLFSIFDDPARNDPSIQYRLFETKQGLSQLAKHPWLGLGLGNSYRQLQSDDAFGRLDLSWYAHNAYLWVGIMMGLAGLVPFLWLCLSYAIQSMKHFRRIRDDFFRAVYLGFGLGFVGMMVTNVVAPTLLQHLSLTIFPVMMAVSERIRWLDASHETEGVQLAPTLQIDPVPSPGML